MAVAAFCLSLAFETPSVATICKLAFRMAKLRSVVSKRASPLLQKVLSFRWFEGSSHLLHCHDRHGYRHFGSIMGNSGLCVCFSFQVSAIGRALPASRTCAGPLNTDAVLAVLCIVPYMGDRRCFNVPSKVLRLSEKAPPPACTSWFEMHCLCDPAATSPVCDVPLPPRRMSRVLPASSTQGHEQSPQKLSRGMQREPFNAAS